MSLAAALLLAGATGVPARAQEAAPASPTVPSSLSDTPALISADQINYDENLGVVTASGNVEISQDGRILVADTVSYNLRTDVVTASGNVSLTETSGDVVFANYVELTGNLREGFIRDIRIMLSDRSRLAAASGVRSGGRKTVFRKGVYSPCDLCRDDPTRAPLWQIKAVEVEHDQDEKVIRYRDAWMEIFGVPVIYTPYFEHPDPTVKRKSGLLAPVFGGSDILGTAVQQPYYWTIGPDQDVTFSPIFTSKQGLVAVGEYRHLLPNGRIDLRASGTVSDRVADDGSVEPDRFRGHVDSAVRFDIDDTWRWGVDAQRASDDTYMRIYNFSSPRTLTSRAFVEGFDGRNYMATNGFLYQGLRVTDDNAQAPVILPLMDYNYISEPGIADSTYSLDANLLALTRQEGRDSRRASLGVGWQLPYTGPLGDIYTVSARLQTDGYWTNGVDPTSNDIDPAGATESNFTGRVFPQLALQWRYPWVRSADGIHQVIEPIGQAVFAPNGGNPGEIPNEDSIDFEFDDTNLFSLNRFNGLDRVDPGTRFDYGLKWTVTGEDGGYASTFVGQSYRLTEADVFAQGSGLEDRLSDVVGRVQIQPTYDLNFLYRFRLDKETLQVRRNELNLRAGPPILNLDLSYISVRSGTNVDELDDREEATWTLRSKISRYWSVFGGQRLDLKESQTRQVRFGAGYEDECLILQVVGERNFFSDREIRPETAFFFALSFKNLGGISTSDANKF